MASRSGGPLHWSKFWWQDWYRDPALRACSPAARGAWMDLLCVAHGGKPYGHVTINGRPATTRQMAGMIGVTQEVATELLSELEEAGVFSIRGNVEDDEMSGIISDLEKRGEFSAAQDGTIFCRRMVRDFHRHILGRENGLGGGNPELKRKKTTPVNHQDAGGLTPTQTQGDKHQEAEAKKLELEYPPTPQAGGADRGIGDDPEFKEFWSFYPRREDKGHARKAWRAATRKADARTIIDGLKRHRFNSDPHYHPLPATWLNGERWSDSQQELPPLLSAITGGKSDQVPPDPNDPWGIAAWCTSSGFATTEHPDDRRNGKWLYGGKIVDHLAKRVAEVANLPRAWRGDWSPMLGWIDAGHMPQRIISAVRDAAGRSRSTIHSLNYFNDAIRDWREAA